MDYDIHGALAAGVSPTKIVDYLQQNRDGDTEYDFEGARKAGVSDANIVKHLSDSEPTNLLGAIAGPRVGNAVHDVLSALTPGSIQRGTAHAVEGVANTADVLGAPGVGGYLHRQVNQDMLNAPSSQTALGDAIGKGNIGQTLYNIPGAVGEAIPQLAATVGGAIAGGAAGTALAGPGGGLAGVAGGLGADALLGIVTQAGDIAKARAKADGRSEPNDQDIAIAVGSSGVMGAAGRIGLGDAAGSIIANGVKNLLGRGAAGKAATLVGSAAVHGVSDAGQALLGQAATTAGTAQGLTLDPAQAAGQAVTGAVSRVGLSGVRAVGDRLDGTTAAANREQMGRDFTNLSPDEQNRLSNQAEANKILQGFQQAKSQNPSDVNANVNSRTALSDYVSKANDYINHLADSDVATLPKSSGDALRSLIKDAANQQRDLKADPNVNLIADRLDAIPNLPENVRNNISDAANQINILSSASVNKRDESVLGGIMGGAVDMFVPRGLGGKIIASGAGAVGDMIGRKFGWSDPVLVKQGTKAAMMMEAAGVPIPDTRAKMLDAINQVQTADQAQAVILGLDPAKYGASPAAQVAMTKMAMNGTDTTGPSPSPIDLTTLQARADAQQAQATAATQMPAGASPADAAPASPSASATAPQAVLDAQARAGLLPSRQPPREDGHIDGDRLPDWQYRLGNDVANRLQQAGTPQNINMAKVATDAVKELVQRGILHPDFGDRILNHGGRLSDRNFVLARNIALNAHGIDHRTMAAQQARPNQ